MAFLWATVDTKERLNIVKFTFILATGQSRIEEVGTPPSLVFPCFFFSPSHLVILASSVRKISVLFFDSEKMVTLRDEVN